MAGNTIIVSVLAETSKFKKSMDSFAQMGAKAGKAVATGLVAVGGAMVAAGVYAANLAKDYEQTVGAMNTLYGPQTVSNMEKWNAGLAKSIGVSKSSAAEIQKQAAIQVRTLGLSGAEAEKFLQKHTTNLADIGAMYNASAEEVATAHSAVMRGEYDSAEKYGVQITADMVKRKMATDGLSETQARQALWNEQSAVAQGQAAKEAGSAAGAMERLKAIVGNLALSLGNALLPALTQGVTGLVDFFTAVGESAEFKAFMDWLTNTAIPAFQNLAREIVDGVVKGLNDLSNWYNANSEIINTLAVMVGAAAAVWAIWTGAIAVWTAITTAAGIAQAIFNAVLNANPVMLVVMAIAALVAGLVYFFTQTETGRKAWATFTDALKSAWDAVAKFFSSSLESIKGFFSRAGDSVKNAWNGVVSWFSSLPGKIVGFFGNAGSILAGAGGAIMDGFLTGLKNSWKMVTDFVGGIATWIKNNKGPLSYDYKLLQPAGSAIMGGFGDSLAKGFKDVQEMVSGFGPALGTEFEAGALAVPRGGTVYVFNGIEVKSTRMEDALAILADEITHYSGVGV